MALPDHTYAEWHGDRHAQLDDCALNLDSMAARLEVTGQVGGSSLAVEQAGSMAYVGVGPRLVAVDVANPLAARVIGRSEVLADVIWDIDLTSTLAIVAVGSGGLQVLDVSNPNTIKLVGSLRIGGDTNSVIAVGNRAYVGGSWSQGPGWFKVIDLTTASAPRIIGSLDNLYGIFDVAIADNFAFLADGLDGLHLVDLTKEDEPRIVSSVDTPGFAKSIDISADHAYVADGDHLLVIELTPEHRLRVVGSVDTPSGSTAVVAANTLAYVISDGSGLLVIDIESALSPRVIGSAVGPADAFDIAIAGRFAYVSQSGGGLKVLDLMDATAPRVAPAVEVLGVTHNVAAAEGSAYVAIDDMMYVIDVATQDPRIMGGIVTPGDFVADIAVRDKVAFVANWDAGLRVIDVSDPSTPRPIGEINTPGEANEVDVRGGDVFVIGSSPDGNSWMQVIDATVPSAPRNAGRVEIPGTAVGVAAAGDRAYVVSNSADGSAWLRVIQVATLNEPRLVASLAMPEEADGVAAVDDVAYVVGTDNGECWMRVIDVTTTNVPRIVGRMDRMTFSWWNIGVAVGDYSGRTIAYVYSAFQLQVVDVSIPNRPRLVLDAPTPGDGSMVAASGELAFLAAGLGGLLVARVGLAPMLPPPDPSPTPSSSAILPTPTAIHTPSVVRRKVFLPMLMRGHEID